MKKEMIISKTAFDIRAAELGGLMASGFIDIRCKAALDVHKLISGLPDSLKKSPYCQPAIAALMKMAAGILSDCITPGGWKWEFNSTAGSWELRSASNGERVIMSGSPNIDPETIPDMRTIAEAGTVQHETGLSPRELTEQNAMLLGALIYIVDQCQPTAPADYVDPFIKTRQPVPRAPSIHAVLYAQQLIQRCGGRT